MLDQLRAHDRHIVELPCGEGSVLIPPSLSGRLFCQLDGELVHRLDVQAMQHPSPNGYDNLGGNSLWPAPEGGPFAFNYPPGSDVWHVQEGISKATPLVRSDGANRAVVEKRIALTNRNGSSLTVRYWRVVSILDTPAIGGYALQGMCYGTLDVFEPLGEYPADKVLIAPWSLEQFPGTESILAFGKVKTEETALNFDFYGDPGNRITLHRGGFTFRLGGTERHQIGVKVASEPACIGALDFRRRLAIIRRADTQPGVYFNIADNAQPAGPFSAADLYSIFNGGELDFFELETIGAMQTTNGHVSESALHSQTLILKGDIEELLRYLSEQENIQIEATLKAADCGKK